MARQNNFLIGEGERLTYRVEVPTGGNRKVPPYDFATQQSRLGGRLSRTYEYIRNLPSEACPDDRAVAVITMHPRFIAKSDFPEDLLRSVGLRAIGSRPVEITPEEWGVNKHPTQASTDELFVSGTRNSFAQWTDQLMTLRESSSLSGSLRTIENISAFQAESKVRSVPADRDSVMLEVVLHNASDERVIQSFTAFASLFSATVYTEKRRDIGGLTFIPVEVAPTTVLDVASHSFVRVARGMPSLRPLHPGLTRDLADNGSFRVDFPADPPIFEETEAVIFDGGIPDHAMAPLAPWVSLTDPPGIGPADPGLQAHGLAVTSAFLFGSLSLSRPPERPLVRVNHVRVLDQRSGMHTGPDMEYFDIIDRITLHLDQNEGRYRFVNLSIGPDIPISDDEVSYWTSALDHRFASAQSIPTVAVGNTGDMDAASGLNRIQPPSDAVHALSVGAADKSAGPLRRADYSSIGPGRAPGVVKPDGLAFGGSPGQPFNVVGTNGWSRPVSGTSFAAPLSLRTSAATWIQLGTEVTPLAIRALMVHRAEDDNNCRSEVGWGRFELDPDLMITCSDDEPVIIYQGTLPAGTHLRAPIPLPTTPLEGKVTITATILVAPATNPEFAASYTLSGFEAIFRPHSLRFTEYREGGRAKHPKSSSFFSESAMYGGGEFELREGGSKWEPCVKRSRCFLPKSLHNPVFDIYNHSRKSGSKFGSDTPLPYALIVSIKAPKVANLYDQLVRAYAGILIPITPKLRLQVAPRV